MVLFTSESVTEGHPDKMCDQISDAILDEMLKQDKNSRVAVECLTTTGLVIVAGEVTTKADVNVQEVARNVIKKIGYDRPEYGFDFDNCSVLVSLHEQSKDIAIGVDETENREQGAGDQGLMFGYATNETSELMPLPISLAHKLTMKLAEVRKSGELNWIRPDGKAQVTIEYENGKPIRVHTIVISTQHSPEVTHDKIEYDIMEFVIKPVCGEWIDEDTIYHINPTGLFVIGGPPGDTGLTGRKIIVDTYGGVGAHGGGCFCVDKDTEYLTKDGWKKFDSYKKGTLVAQWNNGILEFVYPTEYIVDKADKMFRFKSPYNIDMVLSQNHDIVYKTSKGNINKKKVKDVIQQHNNSVTGFKGTIPVYFKRYNNLAKGVDLTDDEIRLQVSFCADGSIRRGNLKTYGRIRIKKGNKIKRLISLLEKTGTKYSISDDNEFKIFQFNPPMKNKSLYSCFKNANLKQFKIIANEVFLWDGDRKYKVFRTTNKIDADFIQFVFMSVFNKSSSILIDDRIGNKYGKYNQYVRKSVCYSVYAKDNLYVGLKRKSRNDEEIEISEFKPSDGKMYCFTVPSGMLLLRRNNRIFVTGNSGKECSKVDRSAAYMARHIAKNIVAAGLADKCEIQIAYAIGVAHPVSVTIDTKGTGKISDNKILEIVNKIFDLRPKAIVDYLKLKRPIFEKTAAYGHFGRELPEFTWEHLNKVDEIKELAKHCE